MNQQKTGGFSGVFKQGKKFRAMISVDGEQKHIGLFTRARDSAMAYDEAIVANQQRESTSIQKVELSRWNANQGSTLR